MKTNPFFFVLFVLSGSGISFGQQPVDFSDIVIHEIMMDPEPTVGLPPVEYVELYNRTAQPVDLSGWIFEAGSTRKVFSPASIPPNGFLLLSRDSSLNGYGATIPLFTSSSTLSNSGTALVLRNSSHQIIHQVTYSPGWISESWKQDGGWSLEMVDPDNPCGCGENWSASRNPLGGTPGAKNSVWSSNTDTIPPEAVRSYIAGESAWKLLFSEAIDTATLGDPGDWLLEPGNTHPLTLVAESPGRRAVIFAFPEPFSTGMIYSLSGSPGITDCVGNPVESPVFSEAAVPEPAGREDIIINEVLHDPYPGSSRFIELFNRSGKVTDLKELALLVSDTGVDAGPESAIRISEEPFLLFPLGFLAICHDRKTVTEHYHTPDPGKLVELSSFPQMKNGSGSVKLILSGDGELIDGMNYHSGMHYPLLNSLEGVSLERISSGRPATDPSNWHSAAENVGFATPAYENSQWMEPPAAGDLISVTPPLFSPDNDGRDDVATIGISPPEPGFVASVVIYDKTGRVMKQVASNVLLGRENQFAWDGIRDDRQKAAMGIYLVYVELLHPEGSVLRYKRSLVVAGHR